MSVVNREYRIEQYGNTGTKKYPNPFFDIPRNFMPKSIKTLFPYCRIYYYRNEFLNSVMKKLVSYPITDIIIENYETVEDKETWTNIFDNIIGLRDKLVEIGLSYNVLGNAIGSVNLTFRRYLKCEHCGEQSEVAKVTTRRFAEYKYRGRCPACNKENNKFEIVDVSSKTPEAVRLILWAPERLDIHFNEFTGDSKYYFTVNNLTKKQIRDGTLEVVDELPEIFLDAVHKDKKIQLDPNNIFHIKQPTLPEDDQGWGKPVILPAMSLIFYMQILRRGNEAIAWEHVVPLRVLFPASQGAGEPLANHNLGQWRAKIDEGIKKWKIDPNHIIICPIPLGFQNIGGDAKALMVTPELKLLEELIINSLGIPIEFVKGGSTWTGSSISLRIVENGFIHYREDLVKFLNKFLIPKIAAILNINPITVKLRRLRMHDDSETKQQMDLLNQRGKISDTTLLEEMGIDVEADKKRREGDIAYDNKIKNLIAQGDADVQATMLVGQGTAQADAEHAYVDQKARIDEKLFEEELVNEQANQDMGTGDLDPSALIHKWAIELMASPPEAQESMIMDMQKTMPATATMVMKRMQLIQSNMIASMGEMAQAEEQGADREVKREQIQAKEKSDKQKAQTRGTP